MPSGRDKLIRQTGNTEEDRLNQILDRDTKKRTKEAETRQKASQLKRHEDDGWPCVDRFQSDEHDAE